MLYTDIGLIDVHSKCVNEKVKDILVRVRVLVHSVDMC